MSHIPKRVQQDILSTLRGAYIPVNSKFYKKLESVTPFEMESICLKYLDDFYDREGEALPSLIGSYEAHFGKFPKEKLDASKKQILQGMFRRITHRNRGGYT